MHVTETKVKKQVSRITSHVLHWQAENEEVLTIYSTLERKTGPSYFFAKTSGTVTRARDEN